MLVGLNNVSFEFGARTIVSKATWHIQQGERIGLIGYNGTGKSTLLKLIVGEYTPTEGEVERGKDITIGYLHQDLLSFSTENSILSVVMGAFERVQFLQKEIERMGKSLEQQQDEELLQIYTQYLHELDVLDGYNIHYKAEEVLHGLGFSIEEMNRPYKTFSGGWRMRVLLAKMILQKPDVLLLDEPTNHLDLPSIEWLEKYLLAYKGSVVIVSHDKYFLDKMVNKIVELYQQQLHIYPGNYAYYENEKALRLEMQKRAYENQQEFIKQQERFIERFRSKATKAAAAQSAIKRLDKLERIEQAEIEKPNLKISFEVNKQPGKVLVELESLSKSYGDNILLKEASAEIERGDKIAFIGANGKGKSTLLRIIAGSESYEGERRWKDNVEASFYAQHQLESLHLEHTIMEELSSCGSGKTELELRNLLGGFMFSGEDVDKKIKILSGGEKARVALAKVITSKSNFLMLDEPTNHLDMHSVELLASALNAYEGTIILVSHDRYFIAKTANKIWEIVDNKIKVFKGSYQEYIEWNERMAQQSLQRQEKEPEPSNTAKSAATVSTHILDREQKKKLQKYQRQLEKKAQDIDALQEELKKMEEKMSLPDLYQDMAQFKKVEELYKITQEKIQLLENDYEIIFEKIVDIEASL